MTNVMDTKTLSFLFVSALEIKDRDAFIAELALSSIWDDIQDGDIHKDRVSQIGSIWDAAHRSVREIAALAGMSQRKLAERFCIPYRTIEDWCRGLHNPPDYVRLMMQECLGLIEQCV